MATSTCPKCGGHGFEIIDHTPASATSPVSFIQCVACGSPIGVTEFYNAGYLVKKQEAVLEDFRRRLERIERDLAKLVSAERP
jgi:predicted nucleic-acid-binding Zn-ribbon protein